MWDMYSFHGIARHRYGFNYNPTDTNRIRIFLLGSFCFKIVFLPVIIDCKCLNTKLFILGHQLRNRVCIFPGVCPIAHTAFCLLILLFSHHLGFVGSLTQEWDQAGLGFFFRIPRTGSSLNL